MTISAKYVCIDSLNCFVDRHLCEQCPVICTSLKIGFIRLLSAVLGKWRSNLSDMIADKKIFHLMGEWVWSNYPVKRYSIFCEFAVQKVSGDRKLPLCVYELWYMHNADILLCQWSMCQCTYYGSHTNNTHIPKICQSLCVNELWYMQNADILLFQWSMCQWTYYGSHTNNTLVYVSMGDGTCNKLDSTPSCWFITEVFISACTPIVWLRSLYCWT